VFADPVTAGPLSKAANNRRFRRALKAAKLEPSHRIHDLRHTFGTRCAAAGVRRTLQEWMGHRDIATTQRYADYAPSTRDAEMIAAAFGGAGRTPTLEPETTAMPPLPGVRETNPP
jgi:integrase